MKNRRPVGMIKRLMAILSVGTLLFGWPFSSCRIDEITTTSTVDGREVLVSLIRGAILSPIDAAITEGVNELFDELVEQE